MANSPVVYARVPEPLEAAARAAAPELAGLSLSELLRAGLAMLAAAAGHASHREAVLEAVNTARMSRASHQHGGGRRKAPPA